MLSLIGRYCTNIKSLSYHSDIGSDNNVLSFFRLYGHKLEELNISGDIDKSIKNIITFSPNLKKVFIPYFLFLLTEDKEFLPKLEKIILFIETFPEIRNNHLKQMKIFSDKYRQTMKTLRLEFTWLNYEELKTCIECIARFENLKELRLEIWCTMNIKEPIDDCLKLIGQKCTKLLTLDLRIWDPLLISDRFFDLFYEFKAIKKLLIIIPTFRVLLGSVEWKCFKHCEQLIELNITYHEMREDFFANIAPFVSKLQYLIFKPINNFPIHSSNLFFF